MNAERYCGLGPVGEDVGAERNGDVSAAGLSGWPMVVCGLNVTDRCGRGGLAVFNGGGNSKGDDSVTIEAIGIAFVVISLYQTLRFSLGLIYPTFRCGMMRYQFDTNDLLCQS